MAVTKAEMEATYRYKKRHIKQINFAVQNTYFDEVLKPAIEKSGMSMNSFIKMCIEEHINREV